MATRTAASLGVSPNSRSSFRAPRIVRTRSLWKVSFRDSDLKIQSTGIQCLGDFFEQKSTFCFLDAQWTSQWTFQDIVPVR